MKQDEGIPLWDTVTHPMANALATALEVAFGCHPRRLSRVFTIDHHSYKVCCDCGATGNDWLEKMAIRRRLRLLSARKRLQSGPGRFLLAGCPQFLECRCEVTNRARTTPARRANRPPHAEKFLPKSAFRRMVEHHYRTRRAFGLLRRCATPPANPARPGVPDG
jgi:hypothetical protein